MIVKIKVNDFGACKNFTEKIFYKEKLHRIVGHNTLSHHYISISLMPNEMRKNFLHFFSDKTLQLL